MPIIEAARAVENLRGGQLVALPTETVYGLAARIDDENAIRNIFTTKQRPFFDPLIVHVASTTEARGLAREWPKLYDTLAERFWPGPLTLLAPRSDQISTLITAGSDLVGLRCPDHPVTLDILRRLKSSVAAPSANRFGRTSPTTAAHVLSEFGDQVAVVDGGPARVGLESTVLSASLNEQEIWEISILRPGGVSRAELDRELQDKSIPFTMARAESPHAPGQTKAHYQPQNPVVILPARPLTQERAADLRTHLNRSEFFELILSSDPVLAARELYTELHRLSAKPGLILLYAENFPPTPEWEVIWDRLTRAASVDLR